MKFKKLIGKITAFVLAGTMMLGNVPVYADTAANSGADVFATQSSNFTIRIPKQLVLSGNEGVGAYRVAVKGNISGTDIITVTPDAEFYMKQEGKSDILATITQPKTNFTYADGVRPETEVISDGVIEMASISAGKWSGLFNFTVTSSVDLSLDDSVGSNEADISNAPVGGDTAQDKHSEYDVITSETRTPIKVIAINNEGKDINASASVITGKEASDLLIDLNKSGLLKNTEEISALIEVDSDGFEGAAKTTFYVFSIANPGDVITIVHFNEETQEWEHIATEIVSNNGTISGSFSGYSPVALIRDKDSKSISHYHDLEKFIQDPTCTEYGVINQTCKDNCGYITVEFIDPLRHDYKTSSTASSCTEEGYTTYTCERCGDSYVDNTVPALGHSHSDWVTVKEPNCTETGSKQKTCSACGDVVTESIDVLGHDYKSSSTVATCTNGGYITYTCNRCNDYYVENKTPATGHSYGDWRTTKEATCTETGSKQKTCSVCGDVVTESIDALGHSWNSDYTVDKEATCTVTGSKSIHCSVCNTTKDTTTIPEKGHTTVNGGTSDIHTKCSVCGTTLSSSHSYTNKVTKEATCTATGVRTYTCECGYSYTESIPAKGHTTVNGGTSAIHTKCSVCGTTLSSTHSYTNKVTKEATCTATGVKTYTCECGYSYTESIPAKGHTSVNGGASSIHTKCSVCGTTLSSTHSYTNKVTKEATCTATGVRTYTCGCGYSYTESIPAKGHTSVNGGTSAIHTKCSVCGTTLSSSHSYTKTTSIAATCTTKGTSKYTCSCGYSYTSQDIAINSSNHTGTITNTICSSCNQVAPGLYDSNNNIIVLWQKSNIYSNCSNAKTIITNSYPATTKIIIPDGTTQIANSSFYGCNNLINITIPSSVTYIGSSAFEKCSGLTSISLPQALTSISNFTFLGCSSLTSVTIPPNVKTLGKQAFDDCGNLKTVEMSNSVTTINDYAFWNCPKLTNITLSSGMTHIGSFAFSYCWGLTNITLPASMSSISKSAFNYSGITNATFINPNGWYIGNTEGEKTTAINSSYLSNSSTAATYLKSTYSDKYWSK